MSRSILIVDDEKEIRDSIKAMIINSGTGFKEIYECISGKQALDFVSNNDIDVVITDIMMPGMNGMEFIRSIQKLKSMPKLIILSGISNFEYAREALGYSVKAYILKPVEKTEFIMTLQRLEKDIDTEEELNNASCKLLKSFNKLKVNEINLIFLKDRIGKKEIKKALESIDFPEFTRSLNVALLVSDYCDEDSSQYYGLSIHEQIENCINESKVMALYFYDYDDNMVIISENRIQYEDVLKRIGDNSNVRYTIGISEIKDDITDIKDAYIEARQAAKHRIFNRESKVICYESVKNRNNDFKLPEDAVKNLYDILGTKRVNLIENSIGKLLDKKVLSVYDIAYTENIYALIYEGIVKNTFRVPDRIKLKTNIEAYKTIYNFFDINECVRILSEYLVEVNKYLMLTSNLFDVKDEIDIAIEYINEKYSSNLNMAEVANYVSLNYTYFSECFKKKIGMNFVDYLKKVRVEKAKELLVSTNHKIRDIAEKVGYSSPKYFTYDFTHLTGKSPKEFREISN